MDPKGGSEAGASESSAALLIPQNFERIVQAADQPTGGLEFLAGGGEMGELMRSRDWTQSPLGSPQGWPEALKMAVSICLNSRFPMVLWWGPDFIMLYNDAWRPVLGATKHPAGLGRAGIESWPEIWDIIGTQMRSVVETGTATWSDDLLLPVDRYGYVEEAYFTYSYSPIKDAQGRIGGVFSAVNETTERVLSERRLQILRELGERTAEVKTVDAACRTVADVLTGKPDVTFALLYLLSEDEHALVLKASCGIDLKSAAAVPEIQLDSADPWRISQVIRGGEAVVVHDLKERFGLLPGGVWPEPTSTAIVLPIAKPGQSVRPTAVLVAGVNPRRKLDDVYRGFFDLVAGHMAAAVSNARAYEEERRRAEALAQIDRAKTVFFSNASHELRTPLTLMLSPLEEIMARGNSGTIAVERDELELIHRNGLRLLKLVNTLLDFSRIEAGRVQAIYEPVDLAALTAELASAFRSAMERAQLAYEVDCAPLPEPVYVDRDMWEKIVLNLLSNAFKYTLRGKVAVRLRCSDDCAELDVEDTGIGIAEHELPRLFERFHRIEGQHGRTYEGTGIGLALVQELVRLHGGTVQVKSVPGKGSAFTVQIPLGKTHLPAGQIGGLRSLSSTAVRAQAFVEEALRWLEPASEELQFERDLIEPRFSGEFDESRPLVLVADDNADMRDYLRRLLGAVYDIETVPDGEAAIQAARRRRPDLVLTDIMMPRLNGFGLVRKIREDLELRDIPVIMLSARAGEEASVEGLESGADDYLVKPFASRELLARVRTNLELARARRQSAEQLRRLNESLEQRVSQEIQERIKAEESFRQAQKMEAIGQLTGGVAHDFNNLLQAISGNLYLVKRKLSMGKVSAGELEGAVEAALRGTRRAATLTQRLLAFSRRQPLDPKPLDPNRLVSGMSELLRRSLGESISIETVLAGGMWRTFADANELENALLNLAVNARDAMPDGGKLTIETANCYIDETYAAAHEEVTPGQYVMIAVSDTGTGMPKDIADRAFEPFFTTKDTGHGTGLGLSQVYGFVKQSGGHVKIYSEDGEGTTVKIYLPRLTDEQREPSINEPLPYNPAGGRGEVILLVEDDEDVRANTAAMLRELGYSVVEASDGREALRLLEFRSDIQLLFTDVGLPGGMNGRQLADGARANNSNLKVLFTSGYARNAIVHQGRLDPGVELIAKPFTFTQLAKKLDQIFGREPG
jgi:signal transduction histidine kinase